LINQSRDQLAISGPGTRDSGDFHLENNELRNKTIANEINNSEKLIVSAIFRKTVNTLIPTNPNISSLIFKKFFLKTHRSTLLVRLSPHVSQKVILDVDTCTCILWGMFVGGEVNFRGIIEDPIETVRYTETEAILRGSRHRLPRCSAAFVHAL
jgi:hypothetical protein